MFRPPIVRALSRVSPRPATASSSRIPSQIPRFSTSRRTRGPDSSAFRRFQYRPFSQSARTNAWDGDKYKRFEDRTDVQVPRAAGISFDMLFYGIMILGVCFYNLETVELTGRTRFNCIPHWLERRIGENTYQSILKDVKGGLLPDDHPLTMEVRRVCERLVAHAPAHNADWKVHVIHDMSQENAFVLPGGRVFVFTGIFNLCQDTDGLAAVLGHEIAHVLAGHPAEDMSYNLPRTIASFLLSGWGPLGQFAAGFLKFSVDLPKSREQEAEADTIGLMLMAKACYNPAAAVKFWELTHRNEDMPIPQILSTHPAPFNRMQALSERLYKAEAVYDDNGCHALRGYISGFGDAVDHYANGDETDESFF
ncbi:hypothetical protein BO78DRAFT_349845 [Aspergillus sclerotiicarbonarius CBS 121057]|uniref:Peptidase M48 domain-containing protein n=1 Tax=Aspergillus sclerotiicarbonarius (strain CBS 121057 / IBT 28362) TaxID=1448318 RepID=A0A319E013_ASPSB|nr:hypothetical protein BO78DRAFT_349845 [Aspergillus sclerotiicarbonarius CBS 121057]